MRKPKLISAFCLALPLFSGCGQQSATIPSYIRIQSASVKITAPGQGTTSNKIEDAWVDDNNDFRGAYQMPVSVPIATSGPTTISLQAGVEEDGINTNLLPYPFFSPYVAIVNLQPGKLDTINPVYTYSATTQFEWAAGDFEGAGRVLETNGQNTANVFVAGKDSAFEGNHCFEADLSPGHDSMYVLSALGWPPPASYTAWLEINYKTDVPMDIGMLLTSSAPGASPPGEQFVSGVNPISTWNKVYIDLGPTLQYFNGEFQNIQIYFKANGIGHIFIDNLKLLYLD